MTLLVGRRVALRPLVAEDFEQWRAVRRRNVDWLTQWEPTKQPNQPDTVEDAHAFSVRCSARQRERQLGGGTANGVFLGPTLIGEMNLNLIQRGPSQSAYVGYWIDQHHAGCGYAPEALVVAAQHAFEQLKLHRLQVAIIPRNVASRRVVEKLGFRCEGLAERYLEINGVWEDHLRYAITAEEWWDRRAELLTAWI